MDISSIKVWFTDQDSKPVEIEHKESVTLVINEYDLYENDTLFS